MGATLADRPLRRRTLKWVARFAGILLAVAVVAAYLSARTLFVQTAGRASPPRLPQPVRQPITDTSAGAQVAWLWVQSRTDGPDLVGVDPTGRLVGRIDQATAPGIAAVYGVWRSADGSTIFTVGSRDVTALSALDGSIQRTYPRAAGGVVGDAVSPDGRWLAMLLLDKQLKLNVIDLRGGSSQVAPMAHDQNAKLPGMQCAGAAGCGSSVVWGMVVFAADSSHLYALTDWGGPARLSAFNLAGGTLSGTATAVDGQLGHTIPSCPGPAMAGHVVDGGQTLVTFCHFDGAVRFFDLRTLTSAGAVLPEQQNPFWLSPIFTPGGRLLYLHQWPGFGDTMQVVDLAHRRLLGPVPTPTELGQSGPFEGLITNAHAGGVASSVPLSPDGLTLYSATDDGVIALRVPDLMPIAKLAPGVGTQEVWISGDGQTIYATTTGGSRLLVMRASGGDLRSVALPNPAGGFIASDHG